MKIVQVVGHFDPGGALAVARDIGDHFEASSGDGLVVALRTHPFDQPEDDDLVVVSDERGAFTTAVLVVARLWRLLRSSRPQGVLSHTPVTSLLVSLIGLVAGVPVRVVIHHTPADNIRPLARLCLRLFVRAGIHTNVVFVGTSVAGTFSRLEREGPRSRVIVNGIKGVDGAYRSPGRRPHGEPLQALYVGRLVEDKNVHLLVKVMAELRGTASLTVAGDGPCMSELTELAQRLDSPVTFVGHQDRDDIAKRYSECDLLLFPGTVEALPLVLIEAACFGLPVIASDIGPAREVLADAAIYCDPHDPAQWVAALRRLASAPGQLQRLGSAALGQSHRFDRDRMVQEYWKLVTEPPHSTGRSRVAS